MIAEQSYCHGIAYERLARVEKLVLLQAAVPREGLVTGVAYEWGFTGVDTLVIL